MFGKEISRRRFLKDTAHIGVGLATAFILGCEEKGRDRNTNPISSETTANQPLQATSDSAPLGIHEPTLSPNHTSPTPETVETPQTTPQLNFEEAPATQTEISSSPENQQIEISTRPEILSSYFTSLKDSLTEKILNFPYDTAIVISDLNDGETISINGNVKHLTGCTINIFPFLLVLEDLQDGKYQLDDELVYNLVQGIPLSQPKFVVPLLYKSGGSLEGGIAKANELRERIGAKNSIMDHEPLYGGPESGNNYFTAEDANLVLSKLYLGQILNQYWTDFAIDILTQTNSSVDFIIPAGVSQNAKVAHKIGWHWDPTGWVYNDIGLVIAEKDSQKLAFALSYFSQHGEYQYSGARFGAELARICWQHFAQKHNL